MEYIEITGENAEEFSGFLNEDMAENLDRIFYRGIGALDDDGNIRGAMVYELVDSESDRDTKSRIHVFGADAADIKVALMEAYTSAIEHDDVTESFYESENESLAQALKDSGFSCEKAEGLDIAVDMDGIKSVTSAMKVKNLPPHIVNLSDVSVLQFRSFAKKCMAKGSYGLVEDLAYLAMDFFEMDISSCSMTEDEVDGALLVKKAPSGLLHVLLYTATGQESQKNLAFLMAHTASKIEKNYPGDTKVCIRRHNATVKNLTDKLFAEYKGKQAYTGKRSEEY